MSSTSLFSRRRALALMAGLLVPAGATAAPSRPAITVHRDPTCGCCGGWIAHLRAAGFPVSVVDASPIESVKARFGVPQDLATCHTGVVSGYVIEGHVPVAAIDRLLKEQPLALGIAVPGMPIGSPGMEGGTPEIYDAFLFGPRGRKSFGRFRGTEPV